MIDITLIFCFIIIGGFCFIIIGGALLSFLGVILYAITSEHKDFNHGRCTVCGKKLILLNTNSYGSRLYSCQDEHTFVCVSYRQVDREYLSNSKDKLN